MKTTFAPIPVTQISVNRALFKLIPTSAVKASLVVLIAGAAWGSRAAAAAHFAAESTSPPVAAPSALSSSPATSLAHSHETSLATSPATSVPTSLVTSTGVVDSPSALELKGSFAIWKRPVCDTGLNCESPTAIAQPVAADVKFQIPLSFGASLVSISTYRTASWKVELSLVWVNPKLDDPTPPYLVTQIRLSEDSMGVVAECSRYDGVTELKFLLPGSCSGRNGAMMFGVSTLSTP